MSMQRQFITKERHCESTRTLAELILGLRFEDIPDEVVNRAVQSALDFFGVAIGASQHPLVGKMVRVSAALGSPAQTTVIGRKEKRDALWAALINGSMAHILDFDDTHFPTILHGYTPILAACLALSEALSDFCGGDNEINKVSGKELIAAFVAGYETSARVALSVHPSHYDRGWHVTGTVGAFGASAACGKLLRLDVDRMVCALGIAASQASGLREMFGTMTKPFHAGKAAQNGLLAALLAREGFTSSKRSLEAERGFCHVMSDDPHLDRLTEGWASKWEILNSGFKPYPCGVVTHPAIDGVLSLRRKHALDCRRVTSVRAKCHPLVLELTGKSEPQTGLEGKFSIYHCLAVALVDGIVAPSSFTDSRVRDAEIEKVRSLVTVTVDPSLGEDQAEIIIELESGHIVKEFVEHASGTPERPLTAAELERKFSALVSDHPDLEALNIDRLKQDIFGIHELDDIRCLLEAASPRRERL